MTEPVRTRSWTRREYDRLVESGFFREGDRVELLGGQLMVAEPQGARHMAAIHLAAEALRRAFSTGWYVRVQGPIALDDESEPEPDLAVVAGGPRDHAAEHPTVPALVVEVAEWSLPMDRREKAGLYARAGIADYWIVNSPTARWRSTGIRGLSRARRTGGHTATCGACLPGRACARWPRPSPLSPSPTCCPDLALPGSAEQCAAFARAEPSPVLGAFECG